MPGFFCNFAAPMKLVSPHITTVRCVCCGKAADHQTMPGNTHALCRDCKELHPHECISTLCLKSTLTDPVVLATKAMKLPQVRMHGPEHHYLVSAVMLSCYANLEGKQTALPGWLEKAEKRSKSVLPAYCGTHGSCGAAVGTGVYLSIVTETTPLSTESWGWCNQLTSNALASVAKLGGPRCCKRVSYLSIEEAVKYSRKKLGTAFPERTEKTNCRFHRKNQECMEGACPYYPANRVRSAQI